MSVSVDGPRVPSRCAAAVRRITRATLALDGVGVGEIGVRLTDDAELRALNRAWRGLDRVTDVLSFPYETSPPREDRPSGPPGSRRRPRPRVAGAARRPHQGPPAAASGDIVISMDRVLVQAKRYRVGRARELARLVVHGTLHLAGHDHHRPGERRTMRAREREALRGAVASIAELERRLALRRPARTRPRRRRRATAAVT
jgi:probable rRNA maturation factor